MTLRRILIGDANIGRFWQALKGARPQLKDVQCRQASCLDTLETAHDQVSDEYDLAILSLVTSILLDECSSADVKGSAINAIDPVVRRVVGAAKKSSHCQVLILPGSTVFLFIDRVNICYL